MATRSLSRSLVCWTVYLVLPIAGMWTNTDFVFMPDMDEVVQQCRFTGNHSMGVCKPVNECPGVISDWRVHNVQPTKCGFDGAMPTVCCVMPKMTVGQLQSRISAMQCNTYRDILSGSPVKKLAEGEFGIAVAGGEETAPAEFPHMVALGWTDGTTVSWRCGGTLISDQYVLTAGHCVVTQVPPDIVRIGEKNLQTDGVKITDQYIGRIIVHPSYQSSSSYHDIALIRLQAPVQLGPEKRPACLWQTHDLSAVHRSAELVVATGYGLTEFGGMPSDGLLKVNLTLVDTALCSQMYPPVRRIANGLQDGQLCAGDDNGVKDTCQGDSGGPLQIKRTLDDGKIEYHVIGITSFGLGCASRTPAVYTRVSFYLQWIEDIVWP